MLFFWLKSLVNGTIYTDVTASKFRVHSFSLADITRQKDLLRRLNFFR